MKNKIYYYTIINNNIKKGFVFSKFFNNLPNGNCVSGFVEYKL